VRLLFSSSDPRPGSRARGTARATVALLAAVAGLPAAAVAQQAPLPPFEPRPDQDERVLALSTVRAVQERVGTALWGGNIVPGTASTQGMRIGSSPRISVSGRMLLVPMAVPPLLDGNRQRAERTLLPAFSAQTAVGVFQGWSPLPTVGGVGSVDLVGSVSLAALPSGHGFQDRTALGWSAGVRVGALRESFTLPGVSLTATYGHSSSVTLGDPELRTSDGFTTGGISDLGATLAVSQRISALRLTAGVAADRYATDARIGYRWGDDATAVIDQVRVTTDRRSWFANAAWTFLVFHATAEVGWQELSEPAGLADGVRIDPVGWWAGGAVRLSI
jgi:hypothetical protein